MTKLTDVLNHKNDGDQWYSYLAPEIYHTWQISNPWDWQTFRKYDVGLLGVSVWASEDVPGTKNKIDFSRKAPFYLEKTGIEIVDGHMETKMKRGGTAKFRIDSVIELNDAMREFSEKSKIDFWWVSLLEISNKATGALCQFRRHNPDGHGVDLYFYRMQLDKKSILYPDIVKVDQEHYLGKFRELLTTCVCSEKLQKFHGCHLDKDKRKPIGLK